MIVKINRDVTVMLLYFLKLRKRHFRFLTPSLHGTVGRVAIHLVLWLDCVAVDQPVVGPAFLDLLFNSRSARSLVMKIPTNKAF